MHCMKIVNKKANRPIEESRPFFPNFFPFLLLKRAKKMECAEAIFLLCEMLKWQKISICQCENVFGSWFLRLDRANWIKSAFQTRVTYGSPYKFVKMILIEFTPSNHTVRKWIFYIFRVILEQCEIAKTFHICKWICFPILTFQKIEEIASEVCKRQASILRNTTRMWNKAAYRWKIVVNIIQIITV